MPAVANLPQMIAMDVYVLVFVRLLQPEWEFNSLGSDNAAFLFFLH